MSFDPCTQCLFSQEKIGRIFTLAIHLMEEVRMLFKFYYKKYRSLCHKKKKKKILPFCHKILPQENFAVSASQWLTIRKFLHEMWVLGEHMPYFSMILLWLLWCISIEFLCYIWRYLSFCVNVNILKLWANYWKNVHLWKIPHFYYCKIYQPFIIIVKYVKFCNYLKMMLYTMETVMYC